MKLKKIELLGNLLSNTPPKLHGHKKDMIHNANATPLGIIKSRSGAPYYFWYGHILNQATVFRCAMVQPEVMYNRGIDEARHGFGMTDSLKRQYAEAYNRAVLLELIP